MTALLRNAHVDGGELELTFSDARPGVRLSLVWLRDHAQSPDALHPQTRQRLIETARIPPELAAESVAVTGGGHALEIVWRDGSPVSRFDAEFLARLRPNPEMLPVERFLWDRDSIGARRPQVSYAAVLNDDMVLKEFLENIECYGFCMVAGVPATPEATQLIAERVAYIRMTVFGGYYDFTANLEHKDTAYTSMAISAHTDGTYSLDAPGYQMFHCLAADCSGGENVLLDGFRIAEIMQAQHPEEYSVLARVAVPGQYIDHSRGIHLMARRPVFRLDEAGQLTQVSYNNHDRAPFLLPPDEQAQFYGALRRFAGLCEDPRLQYRQRLLPGSVLLFDNWRLLHARDAYTGYRRLAGAYLNKEDVQSRLRVLRMRAGEAV
jgi:trimethyllysine dioxygenase